MEAERRLIVALLVAGAVGSSAIWVLTYALTGALGVYVLLAFCILVCAAAARAVGA